MDTLSTNLLPLRDRNAEERRPGNKRVGLSSIDATSVTCSRLTPCSHQFAALERLAAGYLALLNERAELCRQMVRSQGGPAERFELARQEALDRAENLRAMLENEGSTRGTNCKKLRHVACLGAAAEGTEPQCGTKPGRWSRSLKGW